MPKSKRKTDIEELTDWLMTTYRFRRNAYKGTLEIYSGGSYVELDDKLRNDIKVQARTQGFSRSASADIDLVLGSSMVPEYRAIDNYFNELTMQYGEPPLTIEKCFTIRDYFDTLHLTRSDDVEMYYELFVRWLMASVYAGLQRKHNDVMLLLAGWKQGQYKTSWLNYLVPERLSKEYLYTGHIEPSLTNNNTANVLAEKWFINIDDQLDTIMRKDYEGLKAIISLEQISNRKAYAREIRTRKRLAVFCGTVNSLEFLNDYQNRRYFVMEVESIDASYRSINIDRLWWEAYGLAMATNPYKVWDKKTYAMINDIAKQYFSPVREEALLMQYFRPVAGNRYRVHVLMMTGEVLAFLQDHSRAPLGSRNLSNALRRYDFVQKSMRMERLGGGSRRVWQLYIEPERSELSAYIDEDYTDSEMMITHDDEAPF